MKFSQVSIIKFLFTPRTLVLLMCVALFSISITAQKVENESSNLDQCRNGTTGTDPCTGNNWVNGNLGQSNSKYAEDEYVPYRMVFGGLATGVTVHTQILGYDTLHQGPHALDYLGTYDTLKIVDRTTNTRSIRAGVDPCDGGTTCSGVASTMGIPTDGLAVTNKINPNTGLPVYQPNNQVFTMWGGTIQSVTYFGGLIGSDEKREIQITFTATVSNPVLAWSGHIGWLGDWGAGNSAGGISGSPYHMRNIDLNGSGGNQDRSLSADAVSASGAVFIKKRVFTQFPVGTASTIAWGFTASANFGLTNFSLVDDDSDPGIDTQQSQTITNFFPAAGSTITVTESGTMPSGWTFSGVNCVETGIADSTQNTIGPAVIKVQLGEVVTCTFTNTQATPSAAPASVSGRVTTSTGNGIRGAIVTIENLNTGETRSTTTGSFGYYMIDDLPSTDFYVLTVGAKRFRFANGSVSFTLNDSMPGLDFVANP